MVTKHTKLTLEQKVKIEEKLREIQSETPVFLSVKRRCDVRMVSSASAPFLQFSNSVSAPESG
uniref:Uncharacterized protein n=1 Tax=Arundo donax TaxID=35708 RepID=A0A0A8YXI7_ARUDO